MPRSSRFTACLASLIGALSFTFTAPALADLSLSVPSTTFFTNQGTATLDVDITGDGSTSFGAFTLNFSITPDPSNSLAPLETLEFVAPPSDPSLDPTLTDPNYVFAGNSGALNGSPPSPFGSTSGTFNTQLSVADSTNDFSDVTLGNGTSALLARLTFVVPTNIVNVGGDKFDVTLLNPATALQSNVNTPPGVSLTGNFVGVVTVEQPASSSVPEPGSFGIFLAGMAGMAWLSRRRSLTGHGAGIRASCKM